MSIRISLIIVAVLLFITPFFNFLSLNNTTPADTQTTMKVEPNYIDDDRESSFNMHSNTRSGEITFTNVTPDVGLSGVTGDSFAWGDYNNDGYQDLLVKGGRLFKNNGPPNWDFIEVTSESGLEGSGYAVWGDYNNDGYLDFFAVGHPYEHWDALWMNLGPPDYKFLNVTDSAGNMNDNMPGLAAGWADYDRDGFLDLYIVNWRDDEDVRYPDVLWHNNGDGTFNDVTLQAGVWEGDDPYAAMGVNWGDYNNDGWPDIYVSNYLVCPNYLYENNGDGTFTDVAIEKNAAGYAIAGEYYGHTAGSSWADYDHDGDLDMWVSNLAHTTDPRGFYTDYSQMLRNDGPSNGYSFTDIRDETGIEKKPYMSEDELHFGIAWGDYDNDGDYDMFIPQVKDIDYAYSFFFENNGDGTFTDVSEDVGVQVWNTDGACWVDYNNDGYIDLTVEGQYPFGGKREIRLFRNNGGNDNKWLEIGVKASESNSASIGARVKVSYNGITQMKEIEGGTAGHSYQNSLVQHFGFGDHDSGVDVEVWWPSGKTKLLSNISLDQKIVISEYDYDLRLSKMSFSSQEPPQGEIVTITAMIQNAGNFIVDSAKIKFFDGDINTDLIGIYNLKTIGPGKEESAQITWNTKGRSGDHTISVLINEVSPREDYLQNNMGKKDISVKEPDLTVSKISFSDSAPQEGEIVLITATIHNIGDYNVQSATIKFFDGDINFYPIDTIELFDIAPSENAYTYTEWDTTGKIGSYTITVIIEDVVPEEENTQNNMASKNIEVKKYEKPPPPPEEPTNHPPTITEIIVEPENVLIEESCTITVIAEDMDGDDLNYLYQPEDGAIIGFGSVVLWYAPERLGVFEITVTVEDTSNADDVERVYVEVIPNSPPEILNAKVSSVTVFNNGIDMVLFTVDVKDENGLEDIDEVRIDLSEIGGSSRQRMNDDGTKGDKIAGDGTFSCEAVIVEGIEPGEKMLRITVEDKSGEESTYDVLLLVLSEEKEESGDFSGLIPIFLFFVVIVILIVAVVAASIFSGRRGKKDKNQHR